MTKLSVGEESSGRNWIRAGPESPSSEARGRVSWPCGEERGPGPAGGELLAGRDPQLGLEFEPRPEEAQGRPYLHLLLLLLHEPPEGRLTNDAVD